MNIREAAVEIIQRVMMGGYLNLTLNSYLEKYDFSKTDGALLTRIVYSVMTHRLTLEYGMKEVIEGKKLKPYEKAVLLCGYCQMVYFDRIPDYAIINESVALVKKKRGKQTAGFINALLRQLVKRKEIVIDVANELDYFSIHYSQPLWLVKMLFKQYGKDEALKIFEAFQKTPPLTARLNTLKASKEEVMQTYPEIKAGKLADNSLIFPFGNLFYRHRTSK